MFKLHPESGYCGGRGAVGVLAKRLPTVLSLFLLVRLRCAVQVMADVVTKFPRGFINGKDLPKRASGAQKVATASAT